MNSGPTLAGIKKGIQSIVEKIPPVLSVWGFGSFYRNEPFNDVDIVMVLHCSRELLLGLVKDVKGNLAKLEDQIGVKFDVLIMTPDEFESRPLRDMDQLAHIYQRCECSKQTDMI
jgi:predicted nucleotidyltransferase